MVTALLGFSLSDHVKETEIRVAGPEQQRAEMTKGRQPGFVMSALKENSTCRMMYFAFLDLFCGLVVSYE